MKNCKSKVKTNKGIILLISMIIFSVMLSCIALAKIDIKVQPFKSEILPGETISFNLTTNNTDSFDRNLKIELAIDAKYSVQTSPVYHSSEFVVKAGKSENTIITLFPSKRMQYGFHNISFSVIDVDGTRAVGYLPFFIKDPGTISDYVPMFNFDVDVTPNKLDPRQSAVVKVRVVNQVALNITDFTVEIQSKLNPKNNKVQVFNLKPLDKYDLSFTLDYDDYQSPGDDIITIKHSIPSKMGEYDDIKNTITIMPFNNVVQTKKTSEKSAFLKKITVVTLYNDGNQKTIYNYNEVTTVFRNLFTRTEPKGVISYSNDNQKIINWDIPLNPKETKEITIIENYRPIFVVIMLLIISLLLYYLLRSPVVVHKDAQIIHQDAKSGEISKIKVIIHVKNRTGKTIENAEIIDRIPTIAKMEDKHALGTLQPTKVINHENKGTIAKWNVAILEPFEERIITYYLTSRLNIVGGITLKPTTVKFKRKGRFDVKVSSNYVRV